MNVICDRALLGAYTRESPTVNKRLVRRAANEVSGQALPPAYIKYVVPAISVIGLMVLGAALWAWFDSASPVLDEVEEAEALPSESLEPVSVEEPVPEASTVEPRLGAILDDLAIPGGTEAGIAALMSIWGIDYDAAAGPACDQAQAQGFSCYRQSGSWSGMRQLDRPVVLTLTDSRGRTHQPVLVSLDDDVAELLIGGERMGFPADEVADFWFGQYLLIWRPPGGTLIVISPETQNENVRWLRQSLATLDSNYRPENPDSDYFDTGLRQQLMAFQQQNRLMSDGLAGEKTQIIINSLLQLDGTPRLSTQF